MAVLGLPAACPPIFNLLLTFLTLGAISGSSSHSQIQLLRWLLVEKRSWISEAHFLEVVHYAQHVPGPTSLQVIMTLGGVWMGTYLGGMLLLAIFLVPGVVAMFFVAKWIEVTGRNDFFSFNSQWFTEQGPLIPADPGADRLSQLFVGVVSAAPAAAFVLAFMHMRTQVTDPRRALVVLVSLLCVIALPAHTFPFTLPGLLLIFALVSQHMAPSKCKAQHAQDGSASNKPPLPRSSSAEKLTPLGPSPTTAAALLSLLSAPSDASYQPWFPIAFVLNLVSDPTTISSIVDAVPPLRCAVDYVREWLVWGADVVAVAAEAARARRLQREREAAALLQLGAAAKQRGQAGDAALARAVLAEMGAGGGNKAGEKGEGEADSDKENGTLAVLRGLTQSLQGGAAPADQVPLLHHFLGAATLPGTGHAAEPDSKDTEKGAKTSFPALRSHITSPLWSLLFAVGWAVCLLTLVVLRRTRHSDDGWMILAEMLYRTASLALGGDFLLFAPMQFEYLASNGTAHPPLVIIFALAAAQLLPGHIFLSSLFLSVYSIGNDGIKVALLATGVPMLLLTFALLPFFDRVQPQHRSKGLGAVADGASLAASGVELAGLMALIMPQLLSPGPFLMAVLTAVLMLLLRIPLRATLVLTSALGWVLYTVDLGGPYCWVPTYMQHHVGYVATCIARS